MKDELKRKLRKNNKDSIKLDELTLENMHLRADKNQMTKQVDKLQQNIKNLETKLSVI